MVTPLLVPTTPGHVRGIASSGDHQGWAQTDGTAGRPW